MACSPGVRMWGDLAQGGAGMADFRDPERSVLTVREHRKREKRPFAARPGANLPTSVARGPVSRVLSHRRYPKPDRIGTGSHSSRPCLAAWLKQPTRAALGHLLVANDPWRETRLPDIRREAPIRSCSGWGLPCRGRYRRARCAFTAPFHPCRRIAPVWRSVLCGTFPDPGSDPKPAGVTRHPCFMEPGLSSASQKR